MSSGGRLDFGARFVEVSEPTHVSQAFCSALSCGYTNVALEHWEPLATLVLEWVRCGRNRWFKQAHHYSRSQGRRFGTPSSSR